MIQIGKQDKLKWTGDLDSLKKFFADKLNVYGRWKSPGGGAWQLANEELSITWYTNSKSILLQGTRGKEIKKKVEAMLAKDNNDCVYSIVNESDAENEYEVMAEIHDDNTQLVERVNTSDYQDTLVENNSTGDQNNCKECRALSIAVAEIKLDLPMIWLKLISAESSRGNAASNSLNVCAGKWLK